MRSVDDIAGDLYALPPAEFVAARDAAVAEVREAGDRDAAKQLAALKRPTQGAHLVNLLALRRPDTVAELIGLGERIRAAQGTVSAAELRDLSTQRRTAIAAALRLCRSLAVEAGSGEPTAQQLGEAEATLAAAMADESAAATVRSGRVVKALSYAGFGAGFGAAAPMRAPAGRAVRPQPVGDAGPESTVDKDAAKDAEQARRQAQRAARERLARAEAGVATAQEQERAAHEEMDRIADELTRLRGALDAASKRARVARTARQAAERELALARREAMSTEEDGA